MPPRRVLVILNNSAGVKNEDSLPDRVMASFADHGVDADLKFVGQGETIADITSKGMASGIFAVVAGGGDGTVSAVASAVHGSECALGVLPLGTLNHFAKDMHIPLDLDQAVSNIATGGVRKVDVGSVNGRIFINNSSLGLYPHIVRGRERGQRLGHGKWSAFVWALLATLRQYPMVSIKLTSAEGVGIARRTPLIFVGNNEYEMKGFEIGSRHKLNGGKLAVYVAHEDGPAALLKMGLVALLGGLRRGVDFDFLSTDLLEVEGRRRRGVHVAADGEVFTLDLPLVYRSHPASLNVIAPAPLVS